MITLFCDLDNTLIYSHRRSLPVPKRTVESLHGAEQSYITEKTFRFLSACSAVKLIPVTSRTLHQYERLQPLMQQLHAEQALLLNGAVLLRDSAADAQWLADSELLACPAQAEMEKASALLERFGSLRYRDPFLSYAAVADPDAVRAMLARETDSTLVRVFCDSRKIYCTPAAITKGNAVRRLIAQTSPEMTIAIGDSENDLSMLEVVDIPIAPKCLRNQIMNPNKILISDSALFSDVFCDVISNLLEGMESTATHDEQESNCKSPSRRSSTSRHF